MRVRDGHVFNFSSRLYFLEPYAIGSQSLNYGLSDITRPRKQIAVGRPIYGVNEF
jgi:hypothetical protein